MNVSPVLFTLIGVTPRLVVTNFSEFLRVSLFLKVSFEHFHHVFPQHRSFMNTQATIGVYCHTLLGKLSQWEHAVY